MVEDSFCNFEMHSLWKKGVLSWRRGEDTTFLCLTCFLIIISENYIKGKLGSLLLELICLWCFSLTNRADKKSGDYLVSFWLLVWNLVNLLLASWQIQCLRSQGMNYNSDLKAEVCVENLASKHQVNWHLREHIPYMQLNLGEVWI